MGLDRIVCLANSYKHDNRCVAGISLVSKKWVRLVGHKVPGCLTRAESGYADGKEAALLDVFEAELGEECGTNGHPEDVCIAERTWVPLRRFDLPGDTRFLAGYVNKGPAVLQSYGDRIYAKKVAGARLGRSLELIQPEDLWWWIREDHGKRKSRGIFRAGHVGRVRYDLAVTDPVWLDALHLLPAGIYPHAYFFGEKLPRTLLTMSLSEPFEGFHYKLIAGVVNLPA
jgi:hypothetical protein